MVRSRIAKQNQRVADQHFSHTNSDEENGAVRISSLQSDFKNNIVKLENEHKPGNSSYLLTYFQINWYLTIDIRLSFAYNFSRYP